MTNAPVTNARTDRFFNFPVTILIFASFMLGMSEFVVVGILPDIASGLKISEVTVGNLVALFAFVYAPCTPIGSALSARFPRFATYLILMGVFLVGNILCALAPNYPVLLIARLLIASVSGTLVAISMTFAPDVTTDKYRTKFIAWVFSGFSIASVVGVPIGTWVANTFGWRVTFYLVSVLTAVLMISMVLVLPRNSHPAKIGFLRQFRLFFDRRIQLGVLDVVCGAAASYVFYTYLSPIMRDEIGVPEQYLSIGLVIYGCACLWSNLYGGKLADKGRGVEPLTHIRPIYCVQAVWPVPAGLCLAGAGGRRVVAGGARHAHVSAEFRVSGAIHGRGLPVPSRLGELGRIPELHVFQHRHRHRFGGRRSGQRSPWTRLAGAGRCDIRIIRCWHHHTAASVYSAVI